MVDITTVRPLGNRVLVRKPVEKERSFGSIIIPPSANEIDLNWIVEVVSVGPGRTLKTGDVVSPQFRKGDRVIIEKYIGAEVSDDGEKYYIVNIDDVLGVIEDD